MKKRWQRFWNGFAPEDAQTLKLKISCLRPREANLTKYENVALACMPRSEILDIFGLTERDMAGPKHDR